MYTVSPAQYASVTEIQQRWSNADSNTIVGYLQLQLSAPLARFRGSLITQELSDEIDTNVQNLDDVRVDKPTSDLSDDDGSDQADPTAESYGDDEDGNYEPIVAPGD